MLPSILRPKLSFSIFVLSSLRLCGRSATDESEICELQYTIQRRDEGGSDFFAAASSCLINELFGSMRRASLKSSDAEAIRITSEDCERIVLTEDRFSVEFEMSESDSSTIISFDLEFGRTIVERHRTIVYCHRVPTQRHQRRYRRECEKDYERGKLTDEIEIQNWRIVVEQPHSSVDRTTIRPTT